MLSALRTNARKAPALARLGVRNFGHDPAHAAGTPSSLLRALPPLPSPPHRPRTLRRTAETDKWKKISYVAIPCVVGYTCFVMATMKHGHHEEVRAHPPLYPTADGSLPGPVPVPVPPRAHQVG